MTLRQARLAATVKALAALICLAAALAALPAAAWAVPGTVYSCRVVPSYEHPVSGQIEDAGGLSAKATGQAMVESCIDAAGMVEVADSGEVFLTIRMNLMDLTSNHAFKVQEWGSSDWADPALGVTQQGSNDMGETSDICIQVPAVRSVVRVSLFVEQMGREVVCYCHPADLSEGAPEGFVATMVTEPSETGASAGADAQADADDAPDAADAPEPETPSASDAATPDASAPEGASASGAGGADAPSAASDIEDAGLPQAQGLSLSTAPADGEAAIQGSAAADAAGSGAAGAAGSPGAVEVAWAIAAAVVGSGIVLMLVASVIVYWFRRNWNRIGGSDPDDYSWEYRDGRR